MAMPFMLSNIINNPQFQAMMAQLYQNSPQMAAGHYGMPSYQQYAAPMNQSGYYSDFGPSAWEMASPQQRNNFTQYVNPYLQQAYQYPRFTGGMLYPQPQSQFSQNTRNYTSTNRTWEPPQSQFSTRSQYATRDNARRPMNQQTYTPLSAVFQRREEEPRASGRYSASGRRPGYGLSALY